MVHNGRLRSFLALFFPSGTRRLGNSSAKTILLSLQVSYLLHRYLVDARMRDQWKTLSGKLFACGDFASSVVFFSFIEYTVHGSTSSTLRAPTRSDRGCEEHTPARRSRFVAGQWRKTTLLPHFIHSHNVHSTSHNHLKEEELDF